MRSILIVLLCFSVVIPQKKRMSDTELTLLVLNNNATKAVLHDSTLFVYVMKGKIDSLSYKECADIVGANRLVIYTPKGTIKIKTK